MVDALRTASGSRRETQVRMVYVQPQLELCVLFNFLSYFNTSSVSACENMVLVFRSYLKK